MRGSTIARVLSGLVALLAAFAAIVFSLEVTQPQMMWIALVSMISFLPLCYVAWIFLFDKDVKAYVGGIQAVKRKGGTVFS